MFFSGVLRGFNGIFYYFLVFSLGFLVILLHFIMKFYGFSDFEEFLLVFKGVYTRTAGLVLIPFAAALDCGEVNRKRHMGQRFLKEPLLKQMLRSKASLPKYAIYLPCGNHSKNHIMKYNHWKLEKSIPAPSKRV